MLHDAVKSSHQLWQVKKRPDAPSTRSWQKMREKNAQTSHEWALFYPDWPRKWFPILSLDIRLLVLIKT